MDRKEDRSRIGCKREFNALNQNRDMQKSTGTMGQRYVRQRANRKIMKETKGNTDIV